MDTKQTKEQRKSSTIRVGPELKEILKIQKKLIEDVTWGVRNPSDYEAGEILAKKVKEARLF